MDKSNSQPILVIQSLGLGDLLFALPVLKTLKRNYPGRKIVFLTHENYRDFFRFVPEVEETITYKSKTPSALLRLAAELRRRRFGMCVVLNPVFRGALAAFISGAPVRIGYLRDYEKKQSMRGLQNLLLTHVYVPRDQKLHETERYLDLLRMFGLEVSEEDARPRLKAGRVQKLQGEGPVAVLNAGAGGSLKRWPEERFAETGDWLAENFKARVIFIGGKGETELNESILKRMKRPGVNKAGQTSLSELIQLLSGADLLLSNDSGPVHIASALEVPTVALFGPGDPLKFEPLSPKTKILHHAMPCSPCDYQYTAKCGNNLCMQEIRVEEVKRAISEVLAGSSASGASPEVFAGDPCRADSRRKKILYLQSTSEISGTDITLLRTLRALDQAKYEPHVMLHKEGPFAKAYRDCGAKVHVVPQMRKLTRRGGVSYFLKWIFSYFSAVLTVRKIIREEEIDLVHTNTIHNLYGFLAARLAGVPHIWHIREIVIQSKFMRLLEVFLVKNFSDRFIVMDNAIAEAFLGRRCGFPANIVKLYDGIDLERFHPDVDGGRIRNELGIGKDVPLVGTLCRLDPWKGLDVFLEAAEKVAAHRPDVRFFVCGGEIEGHAGYENRLKEKARALGILDKTFFTGWRYKGEDVPPVYRALNVAVQMPVFPEPYGLANLEAMASGVPVVAVNQGGPVELCGDKDCARLVPARDAEAAARAILEILNFPEPAKAMGLRGRRRTEEFFDVKKCTRELEKIYEGLLR